MSGTAPKDEGNGNNETTYTEAELKEKIEAAIKARFSKFADYDELKEKAANVDDLQKQIEDLTKSNADLNTQISDMTKSKEKSDLIATVAKKTGRSVEEISLLNGTDEESLTAAAETIWKKYEPTSREGAPLDTPPTSDDGWGELARNLFSGE